MPKFNFKMGDRVHISPMDEDEPDDMIGEIVNIDEEFEDEVWC